MCGSRARQRRGSGCCVTEAFPIMKDERLVKPPLLPAEREIPTLSWGEFQLLEVQASHRERGWSCDIARAVQAWVTERNLQAN